MKPKLLGKQIALLAAFGADDPEDKKDPPRIAEFKEPPKPGPGKKRRREPLLDDDDDDHDDDSDGEPLTARERRRLSRENSRRRIENKNLKTDLEEANERIEELQGEVKKAVKIQNAYDNLKKTHETQEETVRNMAIRNAIAANEELGWYDVAMVTSMLDREKISVDLTDFTVGGLDDQLKQIAKDKPFLVKPKDGDNKDQQNGSQSAPSGQAPQSSATGTSRQEASSNEAKLMQDFPALQNLV